ncbi:nb-arc domain protein [Leptolyngbya sp. Heron Island J]|uniref:AAA family ATPase n=1 Tax=Leptolyngbya sp. Heron Island J TaxID=1385935 RepID=UPI0003B9717C|nr:ATP-binding protein [Leptolyngbya sp. Heron Island J]ESA35663.1 nb-arc domain protein [Leptolyngbya sp. Heron Island J]
MGNSVRASEQGLAIANQARQRRGWTKTSTARWWQDAHTSRATLRRFWRGERIQQDAFIAICQAVGLDDWQTIAELSPQAVPAPTADSRIDWGEAPDIEQFYGREQELQQLQHWVLVSGTKLINISGLGGSGKTTLALALAEQLQPEITGIIWRSLNTAASLEALLTDLLDAPIETVDQGVRQLLKTMQKRWLIILDDLDIGPSNVYLDMLYRLTRSRHHSCLLIISRQPLPSQFQTLNQTQHLSLSGLSAAAGAALLRACQCQGPTHQLKSLARMYSYNPLALKLVAATIQTVFGGQLASFLAQETVILPEPIRLLLAQQFKALSPLEKSLLFWLAIWQEPTALSRLQTHLLNPNPAAVITALSALMQRALITQHFLTDEPSFGLQPMVMAFVRDQFVEAIIQELILAQAQPTLQHFQLLQTHCLLRPGTDDILCDRMLTALQTAYRQQVSQPLSNYIDTWLALAKDHYPNDGYLRFNLTLLKTMLPNGDD